jgi:hypothetical protein
MQLASLGYTDKWIEYNFLDKKTFDLQLKAFEQAEDKNTANFRYRTFINWLQAKSRLSNQEIEHFLELAMEDTDKLMAGNAIKELFTSSVISEGQFKSLTLKLPEFGDWTKKLITREVLGKRLDAEEITKELYQECLQYKKEFKDNRLLIQMIGKTENPDILSDFSNNGSGKRIRTIAEKRLKQINRNKLSKE